jgi:hypothetical protein
VAAGGRAAIGGIAREDWGGPGEGIGYLAARVFTLRNPFICHSEKFARTRFAGKSESTAHMR